MFKKSLLTVLIITISAVCLNAQTLRYSSDGKTLAVNLIVKFENYKNINQIIFFDALSGKVKSSTNLSDFGSDSPELLFPTNSQNLLVSDSSNTFLIKFTADSKIELQELTTEYKGYEHKFIGLALSTDGQTLYKLYDNELVAYNFLNQKNLPDQSKKTAATEGGKAQFLAIQPNGQNLAEYRKKGNEHSLVIHNLAGKTVKNIKLPYDFVADEQEFSAQFSQNGERLALKCQTKQGEAQITVWDLKTEKMLGTFSVPSLETEAITNFYRVKNYSISPDGRKIAVVINDEYDENLEKLIFLWDVATKKDFLAEPKKYSEEDFAASLAFSPDSKTLAVSSEVLLPNSFSAKIQILDAATGKFIREF